MREIAGRVVMAWCTLASIGCGGGPEPMMVHGTPLEVHADAPFTQAPDFPQRVESTVEAALAYWGGSWTDLAGARIVIEPAWFACGGASGAAGCYDGDVRVAVRETTVEYECIEQTALVHEIGHAVIGDPRHTDRRWMEFGPVLERLSGREGYTRAGPAPCVIYPSVWRHLPPEAS